MSKFTRVLLLASAVVLVAAIAALTAAAATPNKPPYVVKTKWGTFKLNQKIADKLAAKQPINYVFSYQASGIPLFSQQYAQGYKEGCAAGSKILKLNCSSIAPVQTDLNQQLSQIQAKLAANAIDCISIEPATSDGFTKIANQLMDKGIPVFTVGVTSNGHEFTNFTQIPLKEGALAANTVLSWMKKTGKKLKVFAVSGGDPTQFWAQGRMKSFVQTIKKAIPDAKFINTEKNGLSTSYDPGKTYDAYKNFLSAHPDLQFIENVDIGAEHANKAIIDLGKKGKVFTIGWNVSKGQLDGIDAGIQVAALDQRWAEQAAFGGRACATFLKTGKILPNTQVLNPITKDKTKAARADLEKILGKG